ncbi:DUF624 domain-containing protein [Bifidobacterium oedipodis]|nr:DUF624 domain-containing protein [Bifidobacterium sp. DSM 109957]
MRSLDFVADSVVLTMLVVASCIPFVTVGAALSAAYEVARGAHEGRGYMVRSFFRAFKRNFANATALWAVLAGAGLAIAALWIYTSGLAALTIKLAVTALWLIMFIWVWPLQARFDNTVPVTLRNALLIGGTSIMATLLAAAVAGLWAMLTVSCAVYLPQGLFLLLVLGVGLIIMVQTPVFEWALRPYLRASVE